MHVDRQSIRLAIQTVQRCNESKVRTRHGRIIENERMELLTLDRATTRRCKQTGGERIFFFPLPLSLFLSLNSSIDRSSKSCFLSLSLSLFSPLDFFSSFFPPPLPPFPARRPPSTLRTTLTLRRKSDVNGIKSFERAYARVGGATGRGGSMNKGVVAGRWWNMATGIAHWQKREKEPRGLGRERGTV